MYNFFKNSKTYYFSHDFQIDFEQVQNAYIKNIKTVVIIICVMKIKLVDEIHYCNAIFTNNYVVN